ncbi:MAG: HD domain-containing protein [Candidatus Asgardarchaeia archaeon]
MISYDEALTLVKQYIKQENHIKHVLAVEAIMRKLAHYFNQDENLWGLVGLLHDLDFEQTANTPEKHARVAAEILKGKLPEEGIHAILAHNYEYTNVQPKSLLDKALIMADAASGFIIATALVMPSKKLAEVKRKTLKKKFKDKTFARGSSRDRMRLSEEIGMNLYDFLELALNALQEIAPKLGL